mgnify:FL=1
MAVFSLQHRTPTIGENVWIAHNATVVGDVTLGAHCSIWFGATLRGDNDPIWIGEGSNVQDGAILHTDEGVPLRVGAHVSIGHMAMLHGCTIGDSTLIGINAVVLNRAVVGKHCLIGANTLIPEGKVIPDRSLVVGTPGRIIRELTDEEIARHLGNARHYMQNAALYRDSLKPL